MEQLGRELSWDDQIEKDSEEYVLLPEGDYDFEVIRFERGRHEGSEKLPACNKAILTIRIDGKEKGSTVITHNLFLHTITEGMLSAFFSSIGQKKKGERIQMNWNLVMGAKGKAKVIIHHYKNKDGEDRQINQIAKFYQKEQKSWTQGAF